MSAFTEVVQNTFRYLTSIGISDIIDIAIVAFIIYKVLIFVIKTKTMRAARGVIMLLVILWLSELIGLNMVNWILSKAFEIGLIAIVIIFQPELRRLLERMGSSRFRNLFSPSGKTDQMETVISQIVLACSDMSDSRTGALIVFERSNSLEEVMSTGTYINADATAELIKNIFFVKAPLHDGALIIRDGKLAAAGCMLPMSANMNLSKELGMRHRAGIGMSERSDSVSLIVSEETGAISIAIDGMLKRHLTPDAAKKLLAKELIVETSEDSKKSITDVVSIFRGKKNEQ